MNLWIAGLTFSIGQLCTPPPCVPGTMEVRDGEGVVCCPVDDRLTPRRVPDSLIRPESRRGGRRIITSCLDWDCMELVLAQQWASASPAGSWCSKKEFHSVLAVHLKDCIIEKATKCEHPKELPLNGSINLRFEQSAEGYLLTSSTEEPLHWLAKCLESKRLAPPPEPSAVAPCVVPVEFQSQQPTDRSSIPTGATVLMEPDERFAEFKDAHSRNVCREVPEVNRPTTE